jgi:formamidopyrimidine-DNA glycosylase
MALGLFAHRKAGKLPTGEKIVLLKVGGRTSAVVPSLQIKTGAVASEITDKNTVDIKEEEHGGTKKPKSKKRKATDDIKKEDVKKENLTPTRKSQRS